MIAPRGRRDIGTATAVRRTVLHITTVPASLSFLRGQLRDLEAHGWSVHVLSAPGARLDACGAEEGVAVHAAELERGVSPLRDLRALVQTVRVIRTVRPTIVHAHTPKGALIGLLAAGLCGVPVRIYQVRGLPLETARGAGRILLRVTERVTCALAHRVLCDSASLQRVLLAEGLCPSKKTHTLLGGRGSGVDAVHRFNPARVPRRGVAALRGRLGLPYRAPVVGYVGRLARDKGMTELAHAWPLVRASHPSAQLLLVGDLDARDPAPLETMIALRADPSVHLVGRVDDTAPYYAAMDVVVLPSYREGLPNVPLEAAAMGRPVIATLTTGCVDAVRDGVTGVLVEPRSAADLAGAIDLYLGRPALRQRHGSAGRERVLREFGKEPLWQAHRAEYDALVHERLDRAPLRRRSGLVARRAFDIAVALPALVLLTPVLAGIALVVRTTMGRPVLFRQTRAGRDGRPFTLHKFRTMDIAYDARGRLLPAAERLTRVGSWLRRTSLDELPELWDVLRGRMSLVGPRPLLMDYLPLYDARQALRHAVRPGITGWAQVNGRNGITWEQRLELDTWYVEHASPLLDLRILARTMATVLSRRDVSPPGQPIMEPFHGART
ncbi:MAG TPA: sugar transferase [Longimicrobiales bacterium]